MANGLMPKNGKVPKPAGDVFTGSVTIRPPDPNRPKGQEFGDYRQWKDAEGKEHFEGSQAAYDRIMQNVADPYANAVRRTPSSVSAPRAPRAPGPIASRYVPGAEPRREAAPTVGEGQELPGVSGRLQGLVRRGNPYIDRARTRAEQFANRRGLHASSIAAGASEAAAIDAALPIAQADAGIAAGERALRSTEFQQARSHRVQQLMQQRGLDHDAAQRQADRELSTFMQGRELSFRANEAALAREFTGQQAMLDREAQRLMQERGITAEQAEAQARRLFTGEQAALDRQTQQLMQKYGLDRAEAAAEAQRLWAGDQAALNRETERIMQERGITSQEAQAVLQRELSKNIGIQSAAQYAYDQHRLAITAIQNNPNIPAEERERMIAAADHARDEQLSLIEQIHGVELDWTPGLPAETADEGAA